MFQIMRGYSNVCALAWSHECVCEVSVYVIVCACVRVCTYTHACVDVCTHACVHACARACVHAYLTHRAIKIIPHKMKADHYDGLTRMDPLAGVTVTRVGQRATEVEDDQMTSFDCTKGNIDTKITGLWDESLPRLPAPRGEAGCVVLGKVNCLC